MDYNKYMSTYGIIILSIGLITIRLLIGFNKQIRKLVKNELFGKISMALIGIYFMSARYIPDGIKAAENYEDNKSAIFLTDFCPAAGLIIPILAFFKNTRKLAIGMSFGVFISSNVTAFELFVAKTNLNFFEGFFAGGDFTNNGASHFARLHVSLHYFSMVMSVLLILCISLRNITGKYLLINNLGMILYLLYAFSISKIIDLDRNITGLGKYDGSAKGEYGAVGTILGLDYPIVFILGFGLLALINGVAIGTLFIIKRQLLLKDNAKIKTIE